MVAVDVQHSDEGICNKAGEEEMGRPYLRCYFHTHPTAQLHHCKAEIGIQFDKYYTLTSSFWKEDAY